MHLQESGEMYLETILVLTSQSPHVRAIDVGEYMGYSKPSVSRAMGLLKSGGYIRVDENGVEHYPLFATGFIDNSPVRRVSPHRSRNIEPLRHLCVNLDVFLMFKI